MNRNISHSDQNFENFINNCVSNLNDFDDNTLDYEITPSEVIAASRHLKKGKAPGMDGIRSEMLKEGAFRFAPSLSSLFNRILKSGNFPSKWRLSTLSVIHKKGDKNLPKNYRGRPIAVSSNLCKLFCLVLHNRLNTFVDSCGSIPPNQIGLKKGCRTSDHVLILKSLSY
jgi:hypothetical protein